MKWMALRMAIATVVMSGAALSVVSAMTATGAPKNTEWCAVYRSGSENCGFYSEAQCNNNVSGIGGFCRISAYGMQGRRN